MKNVARERKIVGFYNLIDPARAILFGTQSSSDALPASFCVEDLHPDGFDLPRRSLRNAITRAATSGPYFFSGMRGSGKTTELRCLQNELQQTGAGVVCYAASSTLRASSSRRCRPISPAFGRGAHGDRLVTP